MVAPLGRLDVFVHLALGTFKDASALPILCLAWRIGSPERKIHSGAEDVIKGKYFQLTPHQEPARIIKLVRVTPEMFGFTTQTVQYRDFLDRVIQQGFQSCPHDVGPVFFTEAHQYVGEQGLMFASVPIGPGEVIFKMKKREGNQILCTRYAGDKEGGEINKDDELLVAQEWTR